MVTLARLGIMDGGAPCSIHFLSAARGGPRQARDGTARPPHACFPQTEQLGKAIGSRSARKLMGGSHPKKATPIEGGVSSPSSQCLPPTCRPCPYGQMHKVPIPGGGLNIHWLKRDALHVASPFLLSRKSFSDNCLSVVKCALQWIADGHWSRAKWW